MSLPAGMRVRKLLERGVSVPWPDHVLVGEDVVLENIESGAVLHPGVRLEGAETCVGRGAVLGAGGSVVLRDAAVGRNVELSSGLFERAVFLDGAVYGPSGHARAGTLFEEGASAAHAVGTKQTLLLPFATLGSNINFCDALLAGGTGPKDHSEVGSGFIHFNFTPHGRAGDKATPSLFGDVVRGVWLRERRIFLGGAGGVVGPVRVGYGTVLAAGSVYRRDREAGLLVYGERLPEGETPFDALTQRRASTRWAANVAYLGQLAALRAFHAEVRARLAPANDPFAARLVAASLRLLDAAAAERVAQLERLVQGLPESAKRLAAKLGPEHPEARAQVRLHERFHEAGPALRDLAAADRGDAQLEARAKVLASIPAGGAGYLAWVRDLPEEVVAAGRTWLAAVARAHAAAGGMG